MKTIKLLIAFFLIPTAFTHSVFAEGRSFTSEKQKFQAEILTDKLNSPWGMAFLPNGGILITEKGGTLRRYKDGKLSKAFTGIPKVVAQGQGGLLDVVIDPEFTKNRRVYLSFSEGGNGGSGTAVARGELHGLSLRNTKVVYRQNIKSGTSRHFGSRLVFARDGTLYVTHGDRGKRPRAQDPFDHAGSVVRINTDGTVPSNNPFADGKKGLPEIWSIGHRNIQGAALHPKTGEIWTVEHGARGGDEVNKPEAGKNYGWPVISYGRHYSGRKIGVGTVRKGLEQPAYYWDPSIAPSGMEIYDGDLFPQWKGNMFIGALKFQMLARLELKGNKIVHEERLLDGKYGRIRDVKQGPEGALYILSNRGDGLLVRLTPQ